MGTIGTILYFGMGFLYSFVKYYGTLFQLIGGTVLLACGIAKRVRNKGNRSKTSSAWVMIIIGAVLFILGAADWGAKGA